MDEADVNEYNNVNALICQFWQINLFGAAITIKLG